MHKYLNFAKISFINAFNCSYALMPCNRRFVLNRLSLKACIQLKVYGTEISVIGCVHTNLEVSRRKIYVPGCTSNTTLPQTISATNGHIIILDSQQCSMMIIATFKYICEVT